ncbi:MAG: hypothetical protein ACFCU3_12295 [Verrucomicrobiales bacterium]
MGETITFVVCLSHHDAGDVLHRGAWGRRFHFPVSWPDEYPNEGEVWLRVVCNRELLPPMQMPLDGDATFELGPKELAAAMEICPFRFEELVEHARERLDQFVPVPDFPFGRKPGLKTWRESILAGEETHPIWLKALDPDEAK